MGFISATMIFWLLSSTGLHLLAFTGVVLHALQRRRNASATVLWIFVAWSFPLIGPLFYLAFGVDRIPQKGLLKKVTNQLLLQHRDQRHQDASSFVAWHREFSTDLKEIENPLIKKLNQLVNTLTPERPLLDGNEIEPLLSGDEAYPLMLEAIRSARHHIHIQSFIIGNDAIGVEFLDALKERAEAGVNVRLLFDRFGSTHAYWGRLFRKYSAIPNFEIQGWTQANPFKRQFQINLRNHRKNLVVDGRVAFFGGVNIGIENTTTLQDDAIRDYHFKLRGPLVHELQFSFLSDWFFMTNASLDVLLCPEHFPEVQVEGTVRARVLDSGPSNPPELLSEAFFNAIILAQTQVLVVTPYFVPTVDILKALRSAARRGVDVRVIIPKENNHRYAGLAAKALYAELLDAGVRIFERNPPFMHAKAMVIDDAVALVGTANLDVRSLELNYETIVLINDETTATKVKRNIHEDLTQSTEIHLNDWLQRPALQKLGENLCSLMTPIL